MDFATLLINCAWWKDVKDGVLDVNKALRVFDFTVMKSREWKVPELTKACLVAISVIQDEYGNSTKCALEVLDGAEKEFPDDASLLNQRAKVLFHANRDSEALPIANRVLELPGISNVEFVFCCRAAGKAAAKSGNWSEAERYFLLGAEKAKHSDVQKSMGIGLLADVAFALWKQKHYKDSLSLFADLSICWQLFQSQKIFVYGIFMRLFVIVFLGYILIRSQHSVDIVEPLPGMCSNQEPHEGIKDFRIIDISAAWELLASTEDILQLNIGIKTRSQLANREAENRCLWRDIGALWLLICYSRGPF